MRDVTFLLLFLGMMPAALCSVHAGTMLWVWTALGTPNAYLYGFAADLPLNKIAVAATAIGVFIDRGRNRPYLDSHIALLLLFLLQGCLSFSVALSDAPRPAEVLDKMTKITVLCVIMTMARRQRMQIHAMALIVCLAMGIHGSLEGLKYIASMGDHKVESSSLGDNNYLALGTLMVMPLLAYLYSYSASWLLRLTFAGALLTCFVGVIATASRGGLIGLLVLGAFLFLRSRRKLPSVLLMGALALGLLSFAPERWRDRMDTIGTADQDGSFMARVASWKLHTIIALDRPLVGGGYAPLEDRRVFAIYRQSYDVLGFIATPSLETPLAAHSSYFQALGDLGFPGLVLFLAMLVTGFRNIAWVRRRARGDPALAWADDFAAAFRITLVVFMVSGAALSACYFEILYVMLTQISVLRRHLEEVARPRRVAWWAEAKA